MQARDAGSKWRPDNPELELSAYVPPALNAIPERSISRARTGSKRAAARRDVSGCSNRFDFSCLPADYEFAVSAIITFVIDLWLHCNRQLVKSAGLRSRTLLTT